MVTVSATIILRQLGFLPASFQSQARQRLQSLFAI
jgi:hypothetical protein